MVAQAQLSPQRSHISSCNQFAAWLKPSNEPRSAALAKVPLALGVTSIFRLYLNYVAWKLVPPQADRITYRTNYDSTPGLNDRFRRAAEGLVAADAVPKVYRAGAFASGKSTFVMTTENFVLLPVNAVISLQAAMRSGAAIETAVICRAGTDGVRAGFGSWHDPTWSSCSGIRASRLHACVRSPIEVEQMRG
jgi:hypothetical protein